jgi:CTP synthase
MQILELPQEIHPYFVGTQAHPELTSHPLHPPPLFMGFIQAAIAYAAKREPAAQPQTV